MEFNLERIIRSNFRQAKREPSRSMDAKILLDANENSLGSPLTKWYNRFPDESHAKLREAISKVKNLEPARVFTGNGNDECIDLLTRCFCKPGIDNVIICPPVTGNYEFAAAINDVEVRTVPLMKNFQIDLDAVAENVDESSKIIWICSPNDPTGNSIRREDIESILVNFHGIVAIDEAYINFSRQRSMITTLGDHPNMVVLQSLSHAWGLAALGIGMIFASEAIVNVLDGIRPPYNIGQPNQELAIKALSEMGQVNDMIRELVAMREALFEVFGRVPIFEKVYPSDANFIMVKVIEAERFHQFLLSKGISVKDVSSLPNCENCLRITVGTEEENTRLVDEIEEYLGTLTKES